MLEQVRTVQKLNILKMSRCSFLARNLCFELKMYCIFFSHAHNILVDLGIDNNQLAGSIPSEIGTLNSLEKVNIEYKKCHELLVT